MRLKRFVLWLNAAVWFAFGLGYALAPDFFASLVGVGISRGDSYRIMADVGVMMVGIGVWYIYSAIDDSRMRLGLISAFLICLGMLVGRLVGVAVGGSANTITIVYLALETLDSVLLVLALRIKDGSTQMESPRLI
jgi:hypothetical protein